MPKIKTNEAELKKLFSSLKIKTKNFSILKSSVIMENPEFLKIFRFILGINQKKFGEMLGKTYATISQYERKKIQTIPKFEADKMVEIIEERLPKKIDFEIIRKNFKVFYELSLGGPIQGIISAETKDLTEQEKKVETELKRLNIKFEKHKTFNTKIGKFNFDFFIPLKQIVIECTKSATKDKAESLSYRIYKLKQSYKIKSVVIIDKRVSRGFIRRLSEFDYILCDDNLSRLRLVL